MIIYMEVITIQATCFFNVFQFIANATSRSFSQAEMERREAAALVLQAIVRRWLVKKQNRRPLWSRALLANNLTEAKVRRYQEEIEFWQQKHKVTFRVHRDNCYIFMHSLPDN